MVSLALAGRPVLHLDLRVIFREPRVCQSCQGQTHFDKSFLVTRSAVLVLISTRHVTTVMVATVVMIDIMIIVSIDISDYSGSLCLSLPDWGWAEVLQESEPVPPTFSCSAEAITRIHCLQA